MDWTKGNLPGLDEGPALPPAEKVYVGHLYKLKTLEHPDGVIYVFDGKKWIRVEDYTELQARLICGFSPEDRLRALEYMRKRFCFHCGQSHREDGLALGTEPVPPFEQACQCCSST